MFDPPLAGCYPGHWKGRFIWDAKDNNLPPYHCYLMFRKTVDIQSCHKEARIHITAVHKYQLWLNNEYIGRGPAPSYCPEWKSYDTHIITNRLHSGRNVIAILAWYTNNLGPFECDQRPGLWAQLEYFDEAGQVNMIGSDGSWRFLRAQGYRRDVGHSFINGTPIEVYESGKDPEKWREIDFDDSSWMVPGVFSNSVDFLDMDKVSSCSYLEPRATPLTKEREIAPNALVCVGEASAPPYIMDTDVATRIGRQTHRRLKETCAESVSSLIGVGKGHATFLSSQNGVIDNGRHVENIFARKPCFIFCTTDRETPLPTIDDLAHVPESLHAGTLKLGRHEGCLNEHGGIDLAPFIGGTFSGKTAYAYVPFSVKHDGTYAIGCGADWRWQCFIDGKAVFDTLSRGNGTFPPNYADWTEEIQLSAGEHLLVVRVISGSFSSLLSCGLFQKDAIACTFDPFITIDFGQIYNAFPKLEFNAPPGAIVEIACGGEMSPDGHVSWNGEYNWAGTKYAHRYVSSGGYACWQLFECQPVRFLHVVFRSVQKPIEAFSIKLISWEYPAKERGAFSCSDGILTKLWQAGINTAKLHVTDTLLFDPIRERNAYFFLGGELEQGLGAFCAVFGEDTPFMDWYIRQGLHLQLPGGLFPTHMGADGAGTPGFPRPNVPSRSANVILELSNYQMWKPSSIWNRFLKTGDISFLREWYPALKRLAEWYIRKSDNDGLLYELPGNIWFDWIVEHELRGANFENNALYYKMLVDLAEMAGCLSQLDDARRWSKLAAQTRKSLRSMHWNENQGLFSDSVIEGRQSQYFTGLANAMALLYGIADSKQKKKIVEALKKDGVGWAPPTILYFYYFVEGLIKAGEVDYALRLLIDRNRKMLEWEEPPTFWEKWPEHKKRQDETDLSKNMVAKVHFGGTGVLATLFEHVLGVVPAAPGYAVCRIEPQCSCLEWADGIVPTVRGDVHVAWKNNANEFSIDVSLPDKMPAEICMPVKARQSSIMVHNGKRLDGKSRNVEAKDGNIIVKVIGGRHKLEIRNCVG